MSAGQPFFQITHEPKARRRWSIATIEEGMDGETWDTLPGREGGERDEMPVVRVDTARTDKAHDVEHAAAGFGDRYAGTRAADEALPDAPTRSGHQLRRAAPRNCGWRSSRLCQ